jgi:hypothetical protein
MIPRLALIHGALLCVACDGAAVAQQNPAPTRSDEYAGVQVQTDDQGKSGITPATGYQDCRGPAQTTDWGGEVDAYGVGYGDLRPWRGCYDAIRRAQDHLAVAQQMAEGNCASAGGSVVWGTLIEHRPGPDECDTYTRIWQARAHSVLMRGICWCDPPPDEELGD